MLTIIPDIHADPKRLSASLSVVGKNCTIGFLGDFIDAGSDKNSTVDELAVLTEVRRLIDSKEAVGVMGNHELNAILFHRRDASGQSLRSHEPKNLSQHQSFIDTFVRRRMIWNIRGDFGAEVIGSSGSGYAA
jgi:hypothetical protein